MILGASGTDHGEHAELLIDALLPRGDDDQAFQYSEIAKRAEAAYSNIEASLFYQRAIDAGRRLARIADLELAEIYDEMSEALRRAGEFRRAATANASARRLAKEQPVKLGSCSIVARSSRRCWGATRGLGGPPGHVASWKESSPEAATELA